MVLPEIMPAKEFYKAAMARILLTSYAPLSKIDIDKQLLLLEKDIDKIYYRLYTSFHAGIYLKLRLFCISEGREYEVNKDNYLTKDKGVAAKKPIVSVMENSRNYTSLTSLDIYKVLGEIVVPYFKAGWMPVTSIKDKDVITSRLFMF